MPTPTATAKKTAATVPDHLEAARAVIAEARDAAARSEAKRDAIRAAARQRLELLADTLATLERDCSEAMTAAALDPRLLRGHAAAAVSLPASRNAANTIARQVLTEAMAAMVSEEAGHAARRLELVDRATRAKDALGPQLIAAVGEAYGVNALLAAGRIRKYLYDHSDAPLAIAWSSICPLTVSTPSEPEAALLAAQLVKVERLPALDTPSRIREALRVL